MTKENHFFIQTLSDFLNERDTCAQNDLKWGEIYRLSVSHQTQGIIYDQCKGFMPEKYRKRFSDAFSYALFSFANRKNELNGVLQSFREKHISFFTVKGLEIADYYPRPFLRTMGDCDLVVKEEDKEKADHILRNLGFENINKLPDHEWLYRKNNMLYELHDRLIYSQVINKTPLERFFRNAWPYVDNGELDVSFHFLFLLLHLRKHFLNQGVGLRQFMDIAAMIKNEPQIRWQWVEEKINELGLYAFASSSFGFIQQWFGIAAPLRYELPDEPFFEEATSKILNNGVFGFDEKDNRNNQAINVARRSKRHYREIGKHILEICFPSFQELEKSKHYSFFKGKPWLLPAAWVYRLFRGLKDFKWTFRIMRKFFIKEAAIDERDSYLNRWGL